MILSTPERVNGEIKVQTDAQLLPVTLFPHESNG